MLNNERPSSQITKNINPESVHNYKSKEIISNQSPNDLASTSEDLYTEQSDVIPSIIVLDLTGSTPTSEADENPIWYRISLLICVFVICREFHPIEPYFVKYLETINSNYTTQVIKRSVYPIGTYASLILLIFTFLITDYTRYKPIVILDVLAGLASYVLLLNQPSMPVLWIQQVCIGFYHAGEVSYYSYMYSKIKDKTYYQQVTGRVKASIMVGRFISGMTGQCVVLLFDKYGYDYLVYLSIFGMFAATLWTLFLPPVEDSVYFHRTKYLQSSLTSPLSRISQVLSVIRNDFIEAYSNLQILKWSAWWILGMSGYILVITYNQLLWSTLNKQDNVNNKLMNGAVEAVFTITGALSTFSIGKLCVSWNRLGEFMLAFGTIIQGTVLILSSQSASLKLVYLYYILFGCIHYTMLTIASSEIAKYLRRESFALVFGFNKFVALLSISLYTAFVVQHLNTSVRNLFLMFGLYFLFISILFILVCIVRTIILFRRISYSLPIS